MPLGIVLAKFIYIITHLVENHMMQAPIIWEQNKNDQECIMIIPVTGEKVEWRKFLLIIRIKL